MCHAEAQPLPSKAGNWFLAYFMQLFLIFSTLLSTVSWGAEEERRTFEAA